MKEHIINVKLVCGSFITGGNYQNASNVGHFDHRRKSFFEINSILLSEALGKQTCLIPFKDPIGFKLNFINPFATYGSFAFGKGNNIPSVIKTQGSKLFIHCFNPQGITGSLLVRTY